MKKNKVIILISILVVVALIIGAGFLFWPEEESKAEKDTTDDSVHNAGIAGDIEEEFSTLDEALFNIDEFSDMARIKEKFNAEYEISEMCYVYNDIEWLGESTNFSFIFNNDEVLHEMSAYCFLSIEDGTDSQTVMDKIVKAVEGFGKIFGIEKLDGYNIVSNNSNLDIKSEASYDSIIAGNAKLQTYVRATDLTVWIFTVERMYNGRILCLVEHYTADSTYDGIFVNYDFS